MVAGITVAGANSEAAGLVHCVEKRIVSPVGSAVMGQSHKGVRPGIPVAVAARHHALPPPPNSRGGQLHTAGKVHRAWSRRSDERRAGQGGVRPYRSRWRPGTYKHKIK